MNELREQGRGAPELEGQVQNLVDLIAFQTGSVVSKTLMKKDAGTVTLFAFEKDEGLSEHTAPFAAIVLALEGGAQVVIAERPLIIKKGEMVIMPANKPHSLKAISDFKMLLIMIKS